MVDRQNVNSLFISWLTEWRKEAADKNSKVQYIYTKALKSIKKFPISLFSGVECKILEGFGDKVCGQIDERLNKVLQESGNILSAEEYIKSFDEVKQMNDVNYTKIKHKNNEASRVETTSNPHIPLKDSGAYALIVTLAERFKKFQRTGEACMGKHELMDAAQSLSDSSFRIPPPGSRYTAWSSMGTLIKKGLVTREGNPSTYTITTEGLELARKLEAIDDASDVVGDGADVVGNDHCDKNLDHINSNSNNNIGDDDDDDVIILSQSFGSTPTPLAKKSTSSLSSLPSINALPRASPTSAVVNSPVLNCHASKSKPNWFVYVKEDGSITSLKDRAVVIVDVTTCEVKFLVKCKYHDLLISGKNYSMDYSRTSTDDDIFAFLGDADAPDILINNPPCSSTPNFRDSKNSSIDQSNSDGLSPIFPSNSSTKNSKLLSHENLSHEAPPLIKKRPSMEVGLMPGIKKKKPKLLKAASENISEVKKTTSDPQNSRLFDYIKHASAHEPAKMIGSKIIDETKAPDVGATVEPNQSDVMLLSGDFEIVLLVDNRESLGPSFKSSSSEEMLYNELKKNKVSFEVRQLQLGDFVWIARSRNHIGRPVELVLDFIVERKRMDDLSSSIVDGRFREQKFRLSNCGLSNVIYLVEEIGKSAHLSIPESSLEQAIINTQVVDEFFVKRVKSAKDLTNYLVLMTRFLQERYQKSTIHGFNKFFKRENLKDKSGPRVCLMYFDAFSEQSTKSKNLTVSEMFLLQLTHINGVTSEKASAIIQKYPTPLILYEAYRNCTTENERLKLLADLKCGPLKRNLGPALSKTIANLYL